MSLHFPVNSIFTLKIKCEKWGLVLYDVLSVYNRNKFENYMFSEKMCINKKILKIIVWDDLYDCVEVSFKFAA